MLLHYLKIAWRNIRQHKLYTAINVLGLAMGICACIVIYLIARYDLSFDTFHPDDSVNFIKPVLLSILIAMPLAWVLMEQWLRRFAYRIGIGWWIFAAAGFVTLLVAVATVSAQAVKAAVANPVESLRAE